jgi:hypothetical protein
MAEMVGRELMVPAFGRPGQVTENDPGVVDQQMRRPRPTVDESGDGGPVGEVQYGDPIIVVAGGAGDVVCGSPACRRRPSPARTQVVKQ